MNNSGKELEVKFYLSEREALEFRLQELGGQLMQPRVHEVNLRFDTVNADLEHSFKVLRLRQDTQARMTYKGPGTVQDGVRVRQELEFTVGDFAAAQALLEALGYEVVVMYEKFRTTYLLGEVMVMLDEMPYGDFAEIEGVGGVKIQQAALRLGLAWEARILDSYLVIFDQYRQSASLAFRDLSFANFRGMNVTAQDLGLQISDRT